MMPAHDATDALVERVAAAMKPALFDPAVEEADCSSGLGIARNEVRRLARLAIAAIPVAGGVEEPTDAMVKAGAAKVAEMCGHDEAPRGWDRDVARETFKAMARATLNDSSAIGGGDGR